MKFLTLPQLAACSSFIDGTDTGETIVTGKIECFSCKRSGPEKQLYATLEYQVQEELAKSPDSIFGSSPFGPMNARRSRETFIDLISCLNASFPDYDFSGVNSSQFVKEDLQNVIGQINARLGSVIKQWNQIRDQVWATIDREINLRECSIYSFNPDIDSNPFEDEGDYVWAFNYFFAEKRHLKRILFFTVREGFKSESMLVDGNDMMGGEFDMEMMMDF